MFNLNGCGSNQKPQCHIGLNKFTNKRDAVNLRIYETLTKLIADFKHFMKIIKNSMHLLIDSGGETSIRCLMLVFIATLYDC